MQAGRWFFRVVCAAAFCLAMPAMAQQDKPLRIIVPFAPGGVLDQLARALGQPLKELTGQAVVVENKPGASSVIGMQACAEAAPDGSTYCMTVPDSLSYNPQLFRKLPYDPAAFVPVANLAWTNGLIVVNTKAQIDSFKDLLAQSQAQPNKFNWATWGDASIPDVYLKWATRQANVKIVPIPYKGAALANQAVLANEVQVSYMGIGTALPHIESGRIKPIALTGKTRNPLFPGLPTLSELGMDPGLPGYIALFAPPRTPRPGVERFHEQLMKALATPEMKQLYARLTLDAVHETPAQFAEFVRQDREQAATVFKALGFAQAAAAP
jgi:tripartite-type tricarboxylate transporter receptor subunit TctC